MADQPVIYTIEGAPDACPLIVIHGGAGKRLHPFSEEREAAASAAIRRALDAGMDVLDAGGAAVDAVIAAVHIMEDESVFNAGRGAALTSEGKAEMDACLVLGDGSTGAVTGVTTTRHPIDAARAVMDHTRHVLFADPRASELDEWGIEQVPNSYFVTQQRLDQLHELQSLPNGGYDKPGHGTIGVVVRDATGAICAGTSTGGVGNQMPGRVGDSPIYGSGTYANQQTVAISCTGIGEMFVQEVAGYQMHARVLWAHQTPAEAMAAVLSAVEDRGGDGGMICVPAVGPGVAGRNATSQMNWGYAYGSVREVRG